MNSTLTLLGTSFFILTSAQAIEEKPFDQILSFNTVSFHVYSKNDSSLNNVTITPKGLKKGNTPITVEADGTVTGAEIGDINHDGAPELYIYTTSAGSGSYGGLIAYSTNKNLSVSPIYLPPLDEDKVHGKGYMGHDSFKLDTSFLIRSFPIYKEGDSNAAPSGGTRTLKYQLIPGESSWTLSLSQ